MACGSRLVSEAPTQNFCLLQTHQRQKCCLVAKVVQQRLHEEWEDDSANSGAGIEHTRCEAPLCMEPLVEQDLRGGVEHACSSRVDDARR